MSDEEPIVREPSVQISEERSRDDRTSERFSPEDALALFSRQLDSALDKHKKQLFEEIDLKIGSQTADRNTRSSVTTPKFKFEGNAKQYEFNALRLDEITKAKSFLERGSYSAAVKILEQSEKSLKERNKIVRIADKYGWDTVEEYVDDPLTDNTDDATKLRQAEYRAKLKRKEKARQKASPYYRAPDNEKGVSDLFRRPSVPLTDEAPRKGYSSIGARNVYSQAEYYGGKKPEPTRCYYCNGEGHWAYQCPRKAAKYPPGKQQ